MCVCPRSGPGEGQGPDIIWSRHGCPEAVGNRSWSQGPSSRGLCSLQGAQTGQHDYHHGDRRPEASGLPGPHSGPGTDWEAWSCAPQPCGEWAQQGASPPSVCLSQKKCGRGTGEDQSVHGTPGGPVSTIAVAGGPGHTVGSAELSPPLAQQDGAHKLEENVYYFGRSVETLLLRFGKVPGAGRPAG